MKSKIAKFLILCILFIMVLPLNVRAAGNNITFEEDYNVNEHIYHTVVGVMAHQGNYIAWGQYGKIHTSTDGINWGLGSNTWGNVSVAGNLNSIVYNDTEKKYVGIGQNCFASSLDGKSWQSEASSQNKENNDLLYANGKYYVVNSGLGGSIQQSLDGKKWNNLTTGLPNSYYDLNAITYGNGKYIVVGSQSKVLISSDGESWNDQTLEATDDYTSLNDVIYAGGKYVIVGSDGIHTSDNGNTWVKRDSGLTGYENLRSISYGNGKYVVVGGSKVLSSTDGINWSAQSNTFQNDSQYDQVCFDSSGFVATSSENGSVALSTDGVSWTEKSLISTQTIADISNVKFLNNEYVAVGKGFMSSSDGTAWLKKNETEDIRLLSYGNGKYVGIGYRAVVKTSNDGVTWQKQPVNLGDNFWPEDISYGNGKFVLVGYVTNRSDRSALIRYSTDGVNWTQSSSSMASKWLDRVIYANGHFIATGGYGEISTSTDGENWSLANSGLNSTDYEQITDLTVGNGQIIGSVSSGIIIGSSDGITWTKRDSETASHLTGISYGNGQFVAIGDSSTVLSSKDGANWTAESPLITEMYGSMIASNGSGFLISSGDRLFRSISSGTVNVTGVSLNNTLASLAVGQAEQLTSTVTPANATNKNVTWKSSDQAVATVDQNGKVIGLKAGTTVITVTTVDGNKQAICTVTVSANSSANSAKDITSFTVPKQVGDSVIDSTTHTISFHMANGTSVKKLAPTIIVSAGATVNPKSKAAKNFASPVIYTVKAKDGTSQTWTVTCIVDPKSSAKDITSFTVPKQVGDSVIDSTTHTISFHMANGTSVKKLAPTIIVSAGATINPKSKAAKNFASPVIYTVTAQDGTSQTWTVTCVVDPKS